MRIIIFDLKDKAKIRKTFKGKRKFIQISHDKVVLLTDETAALPTNTAVFEPMDDLDELDIPEALQKEMLKILWADYLKRQRGV